METSHQLPLGFWEIEWRTVGFTDHGGHINQETREQDDSEPNGLLGYHDLRGRHRSRVDEDRDEGQTHRDLIRDDLRRRAQASEEWIRGPRRPSGQNKSVDTDRRNRQHVKNRDGEVGQLQRCFYAED